VGNKQKAEAGHLVSDYLKLPLRDLAEVVSKMEVRRAVEQELQKRLAAKTDAKPAETDQPVKLSVHCRSGYHAR
jgi:hypothetical protein